jgi:hypothetical protein
MRASKANWIVAAAIVTLIAAIPRPAGAVSPFCAWYSDGSTNCGFPTMWSCQAAVSGVGGSCGINPRAQGWGGGNAAPRYAPATAPYDRGWMPPPPYRN